jgi:hypothetical protein
MQLLKLTALSSLFLGLIVSFTSCEKESEKQRGGRLYVKSDITMTGAQAVPASNTAGIGSLNVSYSKDTKILSYDFTWTGLKDTITGIAIHGPAPTGYASATIKQALPGFSSNLKTNQANFPYQAGKFTGTLLVDDFAVIEQDLLNHLYYISVRTKAHPATGEIRGQIRFQ